MLNKSSPRFRAVIVLLCACLWLGFTPIASAKNLLNDIPLLWRPTTDIGVSVPDAQKRAKIAVMPFTDARQDTTKIAENREDADKGKILPVTTRDDVPAWCTERVRFILTRLGYEVVDQGGDVVLSGELQRFFVTETSTYEGDIELALQLKSPDGRVLWQGDSAGGATRFGRSYRAENYYEVFSDSMIDLVQKLTTHMSFANALTDVAGPK